MTTRINRDTAVSPETFGVDTEEDTAAEALIKAAGEVQRLRNELAMSEAAREAAPSKLVESVRVVCGWAVDVLNEVPGARDDEGPTRNALRSLGYSVDLVGHLAVEGEE